MIRSTPALLTACLLLACGDDVAVDPGGSESGSESTSSAEAGDGDGDGEAGDGDGDGDGEAGDGDGEGEAGDGDGDGEAGDGDGEPYPLDELLTLDHLQVKATHNSYHVEPIFAFDDSHEYTHPPLDEQLEDYGVRAFELDLHRSSGGALVVYHIIAIDAQTTCTTLVDCLSTIKGWSDTHRDHVPIMVWLEIKDSTGGLPIDDLLLVEQTILEVFPAERLLTPDFVRGAYETLREALETEGWPTLAQVRGKIMFMILNGSHSSVAAYTQANTSLDGRLIFVGTDDFTSPYAAVSKINNPGSEGIADAHAAKIITASNICGAGQSDEACFAKLAAGLTSGTHHMKDDFLAPAEGSTYFLEFADGNPVRCNEATAPPECTPEALENLQ